MPNQTLHWLNTPQEATGLDGARTAGAVAEGVDLGAGDCMCSAKLASVHDLMFCDRLKDETWPDTSAGTADTVPNCIALGEDFPSTILASVLVCEMGRS